MQLLTLPMRIAVSKVVSGQIRCLDASVAYLQRICNKIFISLFQNQRWNSTSCWTSGIYRFEGSKSSCRSPQNPCIQKRREQKSGLCLYLASEHYASILLAQKNRGERNFWFCFLLTSVQIVDCNALPTLILMLRSEDPAIHYEAVCLCHCHE